jgi:RNA polymerase subunit RPABC4/transcription elongation factor Spt4
MIDSLPLDMFGEDDPEDTPEPAMPAATTCPWCEAEVAGDATNCPACGARIVRAESPAPEPVDNACQWCGATIPPDAETCPECGWDARGDNDVEMPGLTTPLTESQVRSLYGGDEIDDSDQDVAGTIGLAVDLINLILPR